MKLNLASNFIFPSNFVDVLSGILERNIYNSYKYVNTSSACCKRNLPILCCITQVKLCSHVRNISKHCLWLN